MTCAYAAFLDKGSRVFPYAIESITDRNGDTIYRAAVVPAGEPALSPSTAEIMTGMLEAVTYRGTASSLRSAWRLDNSLAGKTGTTQDQADGWFIGMTPSLVIGVWAGGDNRVVRFRNGSMGSGANSALPVFAGIITKMNNDASVKQYVTGDFAITGETRDMLNCQDFSERKGLRINARQEKRQSQQHDQNSATPKEKESGAKKFFKKIFGGK
jgi:penicillin-binding protein 1A